MTATALAPDFHVRRHGDTWTIQPLTPGGCVFVDKTKAMGCCHLGERLVLDGLTELVALCDSLFDSGLRCV